MRSHNDESNNNQRESTLTTDIYCSRYIPSQTYICTYYRVWLTRGYEKLKRTHYQYLIRFFTVNLVFGVKLKLFTGTNVIERCMSNNNNR